MFGLRGPSEPVIPPENPEGLPTLPGFTNWQKEPVGPLPHVRYVSRPRRKEFDADAATPRSK
jgi:hypothetical protein